MRHFSGTPDYNKATKRSQGASTNEEVQMASHSGLNEDVNNARAFLTLFPHEFLDQKAHEVDLPQHPF